MGKYKVQEGQVYGTWKVQAHLGFRRSKNGRNTNHVWEGVCTLCGAVSERYSTTILALKTKGCRACLVVEDSAVKRAFRTYKRQAAKRGFSFDLAFGQFKALTTMDCSYCGHPPEVNSYSMDCKVQVPMNTVDRLDSTKSYTPDNCIPCCIMCNLAKLSYTRDEFLGWIKRVSDYQTSHPTLETLNLPAAASNVQYFRRNFVSCGTSRYARGSKTIEVNPSLVLANRYHSKHRDENFVPIVPVAEDWLSDFATEDEVCP